MFYTDFQAQLLYFQFYQTVRIESFRATSPKVPKLLMQTDSLYIDDYIVIKSAKFSVFYLQIKFVDVWQKRS